MNSNQTFSHEHDGIIDEWDVDKLWKLSKSLPSKSLPLSRFKKHIDDWFKTEVDPSYKGKTVVKINMDHFDRIRKADLKYPIIVSAKGFVMDGMHRLIKAWLSGEDTITGVQFETDPEPDSTYPVDKKSKSSNEQLLLIVPQTPASVTW